MHTKHITDKPTQRARRPFPFMLLPAEIRVMIYAVIFTAPKPIFLVGCKLPALTCTSRRLRDETIPVFLKVSEFYASGRRNAAGELVILSSLDTRSWLHRVSLHVPSIRKVTFKAPDEYEGRPGSGGIRIVASRGRPQVTHHDMYCPFCRPETFACIIWYELPVIVPRLRYALHILKKRHDDAIETWARNELPERTAQGFSISQIIRLADAVATFPRHTSPELIGFMQEAVDAIEAYLERTHPLVQSLIDEEM